MNVPNLHPHIVHFPIAGTFFLFIFSLIYLISKKEGARTALYWVLPFTTFWAIVAVTTGLLFEKFFPHPHEGRVHEIMELHQNLGLVIAALLLLLCLVAFLQWKKKIPGARILFFLGIFGVSVLVGITGYFGGELGHTFGLGVPKSEKADTEKACLPAPDHGPSHEGHDHSHSH